MSSGADCFSGDDATDENNSCNQSGAAKAVGDLSTAAGDPMIEMRKGLFGRSASYLQADESGECSQDSAREGSKSADVGGNEAANILQEANVDAMEVDSFEVKKEKNDPISIADELAEATGAVKCELVSSMRSDENTELNSTAVEEKSQKVDDSKAVLFKAGVGAEPEPKDTSSDLNDSSSSYQRIFLIKNKDGTPDAHKSLSTDSDEECSKNGEEDGGHHDISNKSSSDINNEGCNQEDLKDMEVVESEKKSPVDKDEANKSQKVRETSLQDNPVLERRRSLRTRKSESETVVVSKSAQETPTDKRKNLRMPKKSSSSFSESPTKSRTSARSSRKGKKGSKEDEDGSKTSTPVSSRKSTRRLGSGGANVDPFSFEHNVDNHPEPLRNIQINPRKSLTELSISSATGDEFSSKKKSKLKYSIDASGGSRNAPEENLDESMVESEGDQSGKSPTRKMRLSSRSSSSQRKRRMDEALLPSPKRHPTGIIPKLSSSEQFEIDHRPNEHSSYSAGARIFALWDRLHYPALISADRDASGRYEVVFAEDGVVRRLVSTGIIALSALNVGKKCLTSKCKEGGEEMLVEIEIVKSPTDPEAWNDGIFEVKSVDDGDVFETSWLKIVIDSNQVKELQVATVNSVRDVNEDNIDSVERRRTRAARHVTTTAETAFAVPKMTPRSQNSKFARLSTKKLAGKNTGESNFAEEIAEEDKIFTGITFIVTSAVRKLKEEEQSFIKREVRQMIESRGGMVIEDVSKRPGNAKMFLIADTYYRTHKYLSALARSVPCVSHQWIYDCVKENRLLEHTEYMLPAGMSLITEKVEPWHSRNGTVLNGKRVYIFSLNYSGDSTTPSFAQIWSPLISDMGATLLTSIPPDGFDILLTDNTCTKEVLSQASSFNASVVSSEWIIQAIIHGSLSPIDAHERFKYDFVDKSD